MFTFTATIQMQELKAKEKRLSELQNMVAQYDRNIDETLNERLKEAKDKMQLDFDDRVRLIQVSMFCKTIFCHLLAPAK
jgi:DNA repair ATPase RecN